MESEVGSGAAAGSASANSKKRVPAGIIPAGDKRKKLGDKGLWAVFGVLCAAIVGLGFSIAIVTMSVNDYRPEDPMVAEAVDEYFPGYNNVSDAAKALALTESIQEKLLADPNYNPAQAVEDYEKIYNSASGDFKVYVALEYAKYIDEVFSDADRVMGILLPLDGVGSDGAQVDYWYYLADLYERIGDSAKSEEYRQKIVDKIPDQVVEMEEE